MSLHSAVKMSALQKFCAQRCPTSETRGPRLPEPANRGGGWEAPAAPAARPPVATRWQQGPARGAAAAAPPARPGTEPHTAPGLGRSRESPAAPTPLSPGLLEHVQSERLWTGVKTAASR